MALERMQDHHDLDVVDASHDDLRGWTVYDRLDNVIGSVRDLIYESTTCLVRYIAVDLAGLNRQVLLPTGELEIDDLHHRVITGEAWARLQALTAYDPSAPITPEVEHQIFVEHTGTPLVSYEQGTFENVTLQQRSEVQKLTDVPPKEVTFSGTEPSVIDRLSDLADSAKKTASDRLSDVQNVIDPTKKPPSDP